MFGEGEDGRTATARTWRREVQWPGPTFLSSPTSSDSLPGLFPLQSHPHSVTVLGPGHVTVPSGQACEPRRTNQVAEEAPLNSRLPSEDTAMAKSVERRRLDVCCGVVSSP